MTKIEEFTVEFREVEEGWEAEGSINFVDYSLFSPTLPSCLRGVASKLDGVLMTPIPNKEEVIYNER